MQQKSVPVLNRIRFVHVLVFFGPLIAMYAVFYLFSTGFLIYTSFQKISIALKNGKWVGLKNYELLFTDPNFINALKNNFVFAGVAIAAGLTLGFIIAVSLSSGMKYKSYFYAIFLLPTLMPLALVASVFRTMLETRFGSINTLLRNIGLEELALSWLINPTLAYGVICVLVVYLIGLPILYYTANLSTVNTSIIEAAALDGAKTRHLIWQILFSLMKGTHRTIILSTILTSFRAFEIVFFSTGGGPSGTTEITGTYVYNFSTTGTNIGYASAAALIVLVVSLVVAIIQLLIQKTAR